jgi:DNA-binding beta-propeller fold protein YncE
MEAKFHHLEGMAVDSAGNVYVSDTENNRIRKITPAAR